MNKVIKFIMSSVLALFVAMPLFIYDIYAVDLGSFDSYLNEPDTSPGNGYVALIVRNNSSGKLSLQVYQFTTTSSTNYEGVNNGNFVDVTITDNKVTLYFSANEGANTRGTVYRWLSSTVIVSNITTGTSGTSMTYSQSYSSYTIVGFLANGSIGHLYNNSDSDNVFSINWNASNGGASTSDIEALIDYVNSIDGTLDGMTIKLTDIRNYLNSINTNIQTSNNLLTNIFNKLGEIISAITGNGNNQVQDDLNNKNDDFSNSSDEYLELENDFNNNLNTSLDNIDTNVNLISNNDFLSTALFLSNNINRVVLSNPIFESFIMIGLVLGLALFLIGKKVI